MINVEIVYATSEKQTLLAIQIPEKSTVADTIIKSGILAQIPDIKLEALNVGIFSTPCELNHLVKHGDRIEIYRPLQNDPKDARRQRALKR